MRNELDDPPYMTNPYFELPKLEPRPNPYAVTKPTVKPHESKSLQKAHAEPQEVKSLPKIPYGAGILGNINHSHIHFHFLVTVKY